MEIVNIFLKRSCCHPYHRLQLKLLGADCADENSEVMFGENPFAGSRVRQSGTMANDLFVKNRWLLAGVFGKPMVIENERNGR